LDGSAKRLTDHAISKLWADKFEVYDFYKHRQHAVRVLKDRRVLGLAFAIHERWHIMSEERKRLLLNEIASISELHPAARWLAADLAAGPSCNLAEAKPSRGLVPDPPGLPRLPHMVKAIAQEILKPAFRHGSRSERNTPPIA
jgi:hypothetical protein